MKSRKTVIIWVVLILSAILLGSCGSAGAGGGGGGGGADQYGDPTSPSDETFEEVTFSEPMVDGNGTTYTYVVRDRETDEIISTDVTVTVIDGTATEVNASGQFTITPNSDNDIPTEFHVQVPGYDVITFTDTVGGTNIVYKDPLVSEAIGEWNSYAVKNQDGEDYPVFGV